MKSVQQIMTTDMVYCNKEDTLYEVAGKMKERNVGVITAVSERPEIH